jgi:hypothetical protein
VRRVGIVEEKLQLALLQLAAERLELAADLGRQLVVLVRQLGELEQVARTRLETLVGVELVAQLRRFPGQRAGSRGVVPDAGRTQLGLEFG